MHVAHEILVLITYTQKPPLNAHADILLKAGGLNFGRRLHLHPYFVYAVSEGSGKKSTKN